MAYRLGRLLPGQGGDSWRVDGWCVDVLEGGMACVEAYGVCGGMS